MAVDWEKYSFYKVLEVEPGARADEIEKAHKALVSSIEPDAAPDAEKMEVAIAFISAEAALETLSDEKSRSALDAKLDDTLKAVSKKNKVESKRKGKLQEQHSIEDDAKLQAATSNLDSAAGALMDFYYERLFKQAKESRLKTVTTEKLMEWLSSERAESAKEFQPKGRKAAFQIDWRGFLSVQDRRKERGEEILEIVDGLVAKLQVP